MKLPTLAFHRALPQVSAQGVSPKNEQPFVPAVDFDQNLANFPNPADAPSQETLARQAREAAQELATSMCPVSFINVALVAAMKVTDEATENWDAESLLKSIQDQRPLAKSPELRTLYDRLQPHLVRSLPPPLLSEDHRVGEGLQAGLQTLLNPERLQDPNFALFVMAHESAHAEGRHTVRRAALREVRGLLPQEEGRAAWQEAVWDLEREADTRAVELSVKAGIADPRPVLKVLLESPQGEEHPDGYVRALAVRDSFRALGVEVAQEDWKSLLEETQDTRDAHRRAQAEEEEFRRALAKFV